MLRLQDAHGADVCLVIALLWHAGRAAAPGGADVAALEAMALPWRERAVVPLRAARRAMKGLAGAESIRAEAQRLELAAERALLERLAGHAMRAPATTAAVSLALYAGRLDPPPPEELLAATLSSV